MKQARSYYERSLKFYSNTLGHLAKSINSEKETCVRIQEVQDRLNERLCAVLLRIACVSGKEFKWQESLRRSKKALAVFNSFVREGEELVDDEIIESRIQEQIALSEVMLEEDVQTKGYTCTTRESLGEKQLSYLSALYLTDPAANFSATCKAFLNEFCAPATV
jgi:hypothetical protein